MRPTLCLVLLTLLALVALSASASAGTPALELTGPTNNSAVDQGGWFLLNATAYCTGSGTCNSFTIYPIYCTTGLTCAPASLITTTTPDLQSNASSTVFTNPFSAGSSRSAVFNVSALASGNYTVSANFTSNAGNSAANNTRGVIVPAASLSYAFTVTLPGEGPVSSNGSSASIEFNASSGTQNQVNASVVGGLGNTQTAAIPVFNYTNTGTAAMNITLAFNASLPAGITVKAANAVGGYQSTCSGTVGAATCATISTTPVTVALNLAASATKAVWLWADFALAAAGQTVFSLTHTSGP